MWEILAPPQRRGMVVLLVLMVIGAVLETCGIGLVVPALALMSGHDLTEAFPAADRFQAFLANAPKQVVVMTGLILLLAVYVVKFLFLVFLAAWQARFIANVNRDLGQRLFDRYLAQPWTFHLQHNSAELMRNVTGEVGVFSNAFQSLNTLAADFLMVFGMAILLLVAEPIGAIAVTLAVGLSTLVFQFFTRPALDRWGKVRHSNEGLRIKHLHQGLGGMKDVIIRHAQDEFASRFRTHDDAVWYVTKRQWFVTALPRLWYEFVAVFGLCLLAATMLLQDVPQNTFIPTMGLFAAVAFRVLPSAHRIVSAINSVRYMTPAINTMHRELQLPIPEPRGDADRLAFRSGLTLDRVSFTYPQAGEESLRELSLRIPRGQSVGFIGESGAGKSTLIDVILGLLRPTAGQVLADEHDVAADPRPWQAIVGYVPQAIFLCDDTLRNNVAFGVAHGQVDEDAVRRAIRAAQLEEFVAGLPEGLDTIVGERGVRLSGGQRQRVGIARALYHDPEVLVLDEATSALDTETEQGVMEAVESLHGSKTLIIVAHRLSTLAQCDVVYRLNRGRVADSGTFAEVTSR